MMSTECENSRVIQAWPKSTSEKYLAGWNKKETTVSRLLTGRMELQMIMRNAGHDGE